MDAHFVVSTVSDRQDAAMIAGLLEEEGIPVILQHLTIIEEGVDASGVRILVPEEHVRRALELASRRTSPQRFIVQ